MAFQGEVQQIEFSSPLLSGDYRLIEVNPKLADRIESGERYVFSTAIFISQVFIFTHYEFVTWASKRIPYVPGCSDNTQLSFLTDFLTD